MPPTGPGSPEDPIVGGSTKPAPVAAAELSASDARPPCTDCGHEHANGQPCEEADCNCGAETWPEDDDPVAYKDDLSRLAPTADDPSSGKS